MENVVAFNSELSSLYDSKPPISKAKMASITKSAMRAIKFYKHVVQSVEKFILKCKPEYKVPGLYVIDSIVRQSRHQFGAEKDVFAPRFARNIRETFANLFRCAPEDKSRIIRVLNLWQKNNVFAPEVIQPIFDLADPNNPIYQLPPSISAPISGTSGSGVAAGEMSANGVNVSSASLDMNISGMSSSSGMGATDDKLGNLPDLSNNNLKQLLNDPNVIRHLQTLTSFTKFKQQEDKQHKMNEMRLQEEAFEKHLQSVLKSSSAGGVGGPDPSDFSKEVEFVSEEQKIEVINLDGNDSRSPTPDRDRYKRRRSSRSRSRSRDRRDLGRDGGRDRRGVGRRSRSRSRSRSPRSGRRRSSRDRNNFSTRDKERDREHERERRKRGLPDIKKEHLSVCSTTLWVGHLSKLVYQEELSDTFGEYGDIVSIDQIVPRGCAFIVMHRRQDAYKAMQALKNHKLQGRAITISWAAGKGVKSKEWKDFWDLDLGVTYIPWHKLDESTDLDGLEEGGMFDEDSMPHWMKDKIHHIKSLKEKADEANAAMQTANIPTPSGPPRGMLFNIDTTQPPPPGPPPSMLGMVGPPGQFPMPPRMLGPPMGMPGMPMGPGPNMVPGMPPPHAMMGPMGMMSSFPPIPGQVGGPPPHMMPPGAGGGAGAQFPPPPVGAGLPPPGSMNSSGALGGMPAANNPAATIVTSDDQMDIEMEDAEDQTPTSSSMTPSQLNFNQPPPLFGNSNPQLIGDGDGNGPEPFTRDRNRGPSSRWGGRSTNSVGDDEAPGDLGGARWRDNGHGPNGLPNFNEGRGRGAPPNMQPLDISNPPQRPDFIGDFENHGGPRGGRGINPNGGADFFAPNMPNRFNQPTSLMQMRIPPPNSFNPRMGPGGPPMFMRGGGGGGGQGGPGGNRPPGPGGFFNPRNPFDRDVGPMLNMRGGRGGGGRGGGRGGGGGRVGMVSGPPSSGNWSDEEMEDSFHRRGGGGGGNGPPGTGGNRFRDRDGPDRNMGGRGRGGRATSRERMGGGNGGPDFDRGNRSRDRNERSPDRRRNPAGREERIFDRVFKSQNDRTECVDTEEDWDAELKEYDVRKDAGKALDNADFRHQSKESEKTENSEKTEKTEAAQELPQAQKIEQKRTEKSSPPSQTTEKSPATTIPAAAVIASDSLYDELPLPVKSSTIEAAAAALASNRQTLDKPPSTHKSSPQEAAKENALKPPPQHAEQIETAQTISPPTKKIISTTPAVTASTESETNAAPAQTANEEKND